MYSPPPSDYSLPSSPLFPPLMDVASPESDCDKTPQERAVVVCASSSAALAANEQAPRVSSVPSQTHSGRPSGSVCGTRVSIPLALQEAVGDQSEARFLRERMRTLKKQNEERRRREETKRRELLESIERGRSLALAERRKKYQAAKILMARGLAASQNSGLSSSCATTGSKRTATHLRGPGQTEVHPPKLACVLHLHKKQGENVAVATLADSKKKESALEREVDRLPPLVKEKTAFAGAAQNPQGFDSPCSSKSEPRDRGSFSREHAGPKLSNRLAQKHNAEVTGTPRLPELSSMPSMSGTARQIEAHSLQAKRKQDFLDHADVVYVPNRCNIRKQRVRSPREADLKENLQKAFESTHTRGKVGEEAQQGTAVVENCVDKDEEFSTAERSVAYVKSVLGNSESMTAKHRSMFICKDCEQTAESRCVRNSREQVGSPGCARLNQVRGRSTTCRQELNSNQRISTTAERGGRHATTYIASEECWRTEQSSKKSEGKEKSVPARNFRRSGKQAEDKHHTQDTLAESDLAAVKFMDSGDRDVEASASYGLACSSFKHQAVRETRKGLPQVEVPVERDAPPRKYSGGTEGQSHRFLLQQEGDDLPNSSTVKVADRRLKALIQSQLTRYASSSACNLGRTRRLGNAHGGLANSGRSAKEHDGISRGNNHTEGGKETDVKHPILRSRTPLLQSGRPTTRSAYTCEDTLESTPCFSDGWSSHSQRCVHHHAVGSPAAIPVRPASCSCVSQHWLPSGEDVHPLLIRISRSARQFAEVERETESSLFCTARTVNSYAPESGSFHRLSCGVFSPRLKHSRHISGSLGDASRPASSVRIRSGKNPSTEESRDPRPHGSVPPTAVPEIHERTRTRVPSARRLHRLATQPRTRSAASEGKKKNARDMKEPNRHRAKASALLSPMPVKETSQQDVQRRTSGHCGPLADSDASTASAFSSSASASLASSSFMSSFLCNPCDTCENGRKSKAPARTPRSYQKQIRACSGVRNTNRGESEPKCFIGNGSSYRTVSSGWAGLKKASESPVQSPSACVTPRPRLTCRNSQDTLGISPFGRWPSCSFGGDACCRSRCLCSSSRFPPSSGSSCCVSSLQPSSLQVHPRRCSTCDSSAQDMHEQPLCHCPRPLHRTMSTAAFRRKAQALEDAEKKVEERLLVLDVNVMALEKQRERRRQIRQEAIRILHRHEQHEDAEPGLPSLSAANSGCGQDPVKTAKTKYPGATAAPPPRDPLCRTASRQRKTETTGNNIMKTGLPNPFPESAEASSSSKEGIHERREQPDEHRRFNGLLVYACFPTEQNTSTTGGDRDRAVEARGVWSKVSTKYSTDSTPSADAGEQKQHTAAVNHCTPQSGGARPSCLPTTFTTKKPGSMVSGKTGAQRRGGKPVAYVRHRASPAADSLQVAAPAAPTAAARLTQ